LTFENAEKNLKEALKFKKLVEKFEKALKAWKGLKTLKKNESLQKA
jgi:hypothetical protein